MYVCLGGGGQRPPNQPRLRFHSLLFILQATQILTSSTIPCYIPSMTLPESTIIPNPTSEAQAAFLEANKDAMHFVCARGPEGLFPCIALHMVNPKTGTMSLPFLMVPIDPSYNHFISCLVSADTINKDWENNFKPLVDSAK